MKIKLIKLIKNELIKILKRKSIYFLLFLSMIAIYIYNSINPDQNQIVSYDSDTKDIIITDDEGFFKIDKESISENIEEINIYVSQKVSNHFARLYNKFQENSWQRYALKEENNRINIDNIPTDYNLDIYEYLINISDYEYNLNSDITLENYEKSKIKYNEYVDILTSNNWKEYVNLKIRNLEERKETEKNSDKEVNEIDFEIEIYKMRLDNNIKFDYNMQNQYLAQYKSNYYLIQKLDSENKSQILKCEERNQYIAKMNICKYAIENNIEQDISNEENLILNNKIDARISFIRTFKSFDIIIVIIAIYISTTILTEEVNKGTIKNLLNKPHKRSSILISKIIACMVIVVISMIFVAISQYIIGGIIFGFDSYKIHYIGFDYNYQQVFNMNLFKYTILVGISKLPMYIIIILFCILMGIINNHTSMSMILTLIIFLISSTVLKEWSKVDAFSIITRFFITNNWDFSQYLFGKISSINGITIYSSIATYLVYLSILILLSIYCFNKKEINNCK